MLNYDSRPLNSLDNLFEKKIKKRLAKFHPHYMEKTFYDNENLEK